MVRNVDAEHRPPSTRRRGKALDEAILQATWDELNKVGYARLTMEGVATRAKTNKTALYRRWPNRSQLVIAALHKHVAKPTDDVPDTGDLRNDLLILLSRITQPLQSIGAETIHGLMVEHLGEKLFSSIQQIRNSGAEGKFNTTMMTILKNAAKRGELKLEGLSPRVVSLPIDLLRYEFLTTHEPVSDETVTEIIDHIFLPLIRS